MPFINPYTAISKKGIVFGRQLEIGHWLVRANIEGAQDHSAAARSLRSLGVYRELLFFRWRLFPACKQHLGSEQPDAICAICECQTQFFRR